MDHPSYNEVYNQPVSLEWLYETLSQYGDWEKKDNGDILLNQLPLGNEAFFLSCTQGGVLTRIDQVLSQVKLKKRHFMKKHWMCVGRVTETARQAIAAVGGQCLELPMLHADMPPLVLVFLPERDDLIWFDDGFNHSIGSLVAESNQIICVLYSQNITQDFGQESIEDLILCSESEWRVVWQAASNQ